VDPCSVVGLEVMRCPSRGSAVAGLLQFTQQRKRAPLLEADAGALYVSRAYPQQPPSALPYHHPRRSALSATMIPPASGGVMPEGSPTAATWRKCQVWASLHIRDSGCCRCDWDPKRTTSAGRHLCNAAVPGVFMYLHVILRLLSKPPTEPPAPRSPAHRQPLRWRAWKHGHRVSHVQGVRCSRF